METEPQGKAMAGRAQDAGRSEGRAVMARIEAEVWSDIASDPERGADVQRVFDGKNAEADSTTSVVE